MNVLKSTFSKLVAWFKNQRASYPRVVQFANGKYGVEVKSGLFLGADDPYYKWSTPRYVYEYCMFDSLPDALDHLNKYLAEKRNRDVSVVRVIERGLQ